MTVPDAFLFLFIQRRDASLTQSNHKQYGMVMIRDTGLTDETHIELARKFGELDDVTPYNKAGRKNRLKFDELFDVGNIEADGKIVDPKSPRAQANKVSRRARYMLGPHTQTVWF